VTKNSNSIDFEYRAFDQKNPKRIAASLKHSAEQSGRRKSSPFQSAMSMLTFYMNRAGKNLSDGQKRRLERVKGELRKDFGRDQIRPTAPAESRETLNHRERHNPCLGADRARRNDLEARDPGPACAARTAPSRRSDPAAENRRELPVQNVALALPDRRVPDSACLDPYRLALSAYRTPVPKVEATGGKGSS
jgi:hypothetical protein